MVRLPADCDPATQAVHAGESEDPVYGAVNEAIVTSTTFRYPEHPEGQDAPFLYSRYDNPTVRSVERKIAALEAGTGEPGACFLFASGMAAEAAIFHATLRPGDTIALMQGAYGGTHALLHDEFASKGITIHPVAPDAHGDPLPDGTRLVWLESVTNPLLRVPNLAAWADTAHAAGAMLAVDATFAGPILQRPFEHGADFVMHSATKSLNGHSDVTAGAVCLRPDADDELVRSIWTRRRNLGATLDPMPAYLLGRGMKTLPLRIETQCAAAAAIADAAAGHDAVTRVAYPARSDHPDAAVAGRMLMDGRGGTVVTIDLGSREAATAFRRAVRVMTPAASLGGVESLVSLPIETSHAYASLEERTAQGIGDGLVRISVGAEDVEDLLADLDQALDAARATQK